MHLTDDAARGIMDQIPDVLTVAAPPFEWTFRARYSFESSFSYQG